MPITLLKWISLPVLLTGSLFVHFAGTYEMVLNLLICAGALMVVQRGVYAREYLWAGGFVSVAIIFSPMPLVVKIFLLLIFSCIGALAGVYAAWKAQPVESR